jgi:hypothetical protein
VYDVEHVELLVSRAPDAGEGRTRTGTPVGRGWCWPVRSWRSPSLPMLAVTSSMVVAVLLAVTGGAGAILVEVLADTGLQRCLDEEVLGRAYGFALPAAVSGIVVGSLVAAPLVALLGVDGALVVLGVLVTVHALALLRSPSPRDASAPVGDLALVAG